MKNLISNIIRTIILLLILFINNTYSQSDYFEQPVTVPVFSGTVVPTNGEKNIYWDLREVFDNRIDLVAGVTQTGYVPPNVYNYTNGNWYKNEDNSNFNYEVIDDRFVYGEVSSINGITGLVSVQLNNDPAKKKDVIVTRADGNLYVYEHDDQNQRIKLDYSQRIFNVNGSVAAVGKFTTDTLEDVAVISGSDLKIYKNLGNSKLDTTPVYTIHGIYAKKVLIAQVSNYIYPYSIIENTTSDRDEIIVRSGSTIRIYKNNNSNGISDSTSIVISGTTPSDFKLTDINNDGLND
ncbi:MAG: hypothetical protein SGI89_05720 [bacterium]|nr:hypothetical protein [bacterium]